MRRARIFVGVFIGFIAFAVWLLGAAVFADEPDPVRPTPTVVPNPPVQPAESAQDGQPDLVVKEINVIPNNPTVERNFRIDVVIANEGDGDVPPPGEPGGGNFFTDLYIDPPAPPIPGVSADPTHSWGIQYFWVPAGAEWTLSFTTQFTNTGRHNVYAVVDPTGQIVETDEENNVAGPERFEVSTSRFWRQSSHEDFQKGFSNLNLSHSRGLAQIGFNLDRYIRTNREEVRYVRQQFDEPEFDRDIYFPDTVVNPLTYPNPSNQSEMITDTALQIKPHLTQGPNPNEVGMVWEDWRRGGLDSDVYFSRSTDAGSSWSTGVRVSDDPPTSTFSQLDPTVTYSPHCNGLYYAFWADNRPVDSRRSYNIWYAYSTDGQTWVEPAAAPHKNPLNTFDSDTFEAPQTNPSVAVNDEGRLFVAWQDRRSGNEDIYLAYSESVDCSLLTDGDPATHPVTWSDNSFVSDDIDRGEASKDQVAPSIAVIGDTLADTHVYLGWEDRSEDLGDVYVARGRYTGGTSSTAEDFTFDIDMKANTDGTTESQRSPDLDAIEITAEVTYTVQIQSGGQTEEFECASLWGADAIHVAWQDYRDGNPDVYYTWIFTEFDFLRFLNDDPGIACELESSNNEPDSQPYTPNGNFNVVPYEMEELSNDTVPSTRSCWGPNSGSVSPFSEDWQGEPTIFAPNPLEVFVGWSDGRSYGEQNYDIHMMQLSRNSEDSLNYTDDTGLLMVNDNVKRLGLFVDGDSYSDLYNDYAPAGASQRRPDFLVLPANSGIPPRVLMTWDDNRHSDPFSGGAINRDVFVAREGTTTIESSGTKRLGEPRGTYISPVFDAGSEVTWYNIDWWSATQTYGQLLFQVRLGTTPTPPLDDEAANGWTKWSGIGGVGGSYDAPGQNIRDSDGSLFPEYQYAQYRLLINPGRDTVNTTSPPSETEFNGACVSEITLNYQPELQYLYLPVVLKGGGGTAAAVPNDTYYPTYQWHMRFIDSEAAWAQSKGDSIPISIIDTGIDSGHPDLSDKIVGGHDYVDGDDTPNDTNGHGTHVAGIAAAVTDDDNGVAGVGWNAQIMPMKVFDDFGRALSDDVALAIRDSVDQGAKVINLSLGGPDDSTLLRDAVSYARSKGALVVAAAGNKFKIENKPQYPAAISEVLAVGSVTDGQTHASYSNTGSYVDVVAPGGDPISDTDSTITHWIWSTYPRSKPGIPATGYMAAAGTSQATPHVAGLAALIWSKNPALNADQVMNLIMNTSTDLGPSGRDDTFGHGLVNADAAVSQAGTTLARAGADEEPLRTLAREPAPFNAAAEYAPGELIVALDTGVSRQAFDPSLAAYGVELEQEILDGVWLASVPKDQMLTALDTLSAQPGVRYVEPNYTYHLPDPQWRK